MVRKTATLLMLLFSVAAAAEWSGIDWKQTLYNPKPQPDDLIVPMPCGGAMAFRRVAAEADGPLGDLRIEVGSDAEAQGYIEHTRPGFVAGSFGGDGHQRDLLVGKYEVTRLQYDAVFAAAQEKPCPTPRRSGRLPQTRVGWFDAQRFAHQYSLWLRRHAASLPDCSNGGSACLPRVDGEPAFARLLSEVEWEYAARGGARVSPADFRELRFPMDGGAEGYAWFNENADGKVRPIGVLASNPLGLYDMLGNVDEIVLDPFRLHRLDRYHGQLGGYVVRGGSIHSDRGELRSSLRREVPLYDDRGAVSTADTGFRIGLAVPVIHSHQRLATIEEAWGRLGTEIAAPRASLDDESFQDPVLELTALARAAPDRAMKRRLERLRAVMAEQNQRLIEQRDRNARETLRFGGLLCLKLHDEGRNVDKRGEVQAQCVEGFGAAHARCAKRAEQLTRDQQTLAQNVDFYADSVVRTAQTYLQDVAVLRRQLERLKTEIAERGYAEYRVYPEAFLRQVTAYAGSGTVEREVWFEECRTLK